MDIINEIRGVDDKIDAIDAKIAELNKAKQSLIGQKAYLHRELKISALLEEKMGITDRDDISDILEMIRAKGYLSGEKL